MLFTADEIEKCLTELQSHGEARADGIVNEGMEFGGREMVKMMVLLYSWV